MLTNSGQMLHVNVMLSIATSAALAARGLVTMMQSPNTTYDLSAMLANEGSNAAGSSSHMHTSSSGPASWQHHGAPTTPIRTGEGVLPGMYRFIV